MAGWRIHAEQRVSDTANGRVGNLEYAKGFIPS